MNFAKVLWEVKPQQKYVGQLSNQNVDMVDR